MPLRIAHLSTFYHTSILLIAQGNIDREISADVQWRLFGTGPAIVDAFQRGEIDLAYIGLPPAIIGMDKGVKFKCIAGGHVEGTVIIGGAECKGSPETDDLAEVLTQFRGHKIGVPGKGSIHDVIITECLERFNLKSEIDIVNFRWSDLIIDAMHKGQVAAAVGTPALAVALGRFAGGKILCPPSKLWPDNPSYGILVEDNFLNGHRETIERFLKLHEEATAFFRNRPREAAKIISDYTGIVDADFVLDTLNISPKYCASITKGYISSTMAFVKVLKRLGYISRELSDEEIFDTSMIKKIHPSKDHYQDGIAI
ncbi:MAG: ABC transporter substrate-binding protein [Nitrospirae bacterium]|nr:ABC transporter substrate-binding protein [Nitrospirota bacterium]